MADHKLSAAATLNRSEEDILDAQAKSDSFWDLGNYKKVVKRIDDGARLCGDMVKMAQERAEIEAKYARHLQTWAKKWEDIVSKGPEYGTMEAGWKAAFKGASRMAEVHSEMCRKIHDDIMESIQSWKNENFHKSLMALKESKKAEDHFAKAQKPWEKRLAKSNRCRKTYHQAGRELEALEAALHEAETNDSISPEQCSKVRDKTEKAQKEVDKTLQKYKDRLGDVQHYKSRYVEDMTMEFSKCQEMEQARLTFFKNTLTRFKEILDTMNKPIVKEILHDYGKSLSDVNPEEDLRWYAINFGTGMNYNWPEFEEYVPGQGSKSSTAATSHSPSVHHHTLSTTTTSRNPPSLPGPTAGSSSRSSGTPVHHRSDHGGSSTSSSPTPSSSRAYEVVGFESGRDDREDDWMEPPPVEMSSPTASTGAVGSRSSSEEPQGQLMRAIYDYSGSQEDDITFNEGDLVRIMYEGEDGWAEGLLGEKYGYVPIAYFEPIDNQ